jgi:hypothetical protein
MVTIGQLRIDWAGRVEILVYDQNRFIRSWIMKRFKEVKNPYQRGGGLLLLYGIGTLLGRAVGTPLSNRWATNPSISSDDRAVLDKMIC